MKTSKLSTYIGKNQNQGILINNYQQSESNVHLTSFSKNINQRQLKKN